MYIQGLLLILKLGIYDNLSAYMVFIIIFIFIQEEAINGTTSIFPEWFLADVANLGWGY